MTSRRKSFFIAAEILLAVIMAAAAISAIAAASPAGPAAQTVSPQKQELLSLTPGWEPAPAEDGPGAAYAVLAASSFAAAALAAVWLILRHKYSTSRRQNKEALEMRRG